MEHPQNQKNELIIYPENFKEAIKNGEDFYIQFSIMTPEVEGTLNKAVHRYLEQYDILYMRDMLIIVLKELINNAIKANVKRLYFRQKFLDIRNKDDYRIGMESFKDDVFTGDQSYLEQLSSAKLVVRVFFKNHPETLRLSVINNIPIMDEELKKVESRIKKARIYSEISDAFDDVLDDSEGAGLGLIMALILFKNVGFPKEAFSVTTDGKLTIAKIIIPKNPGSSDFRIKVASEILEEVGNIPSFPENILVIQRLCANPESTIRDIADSIKRDPGLVTAILKLANSAGYITINRVETIEDAVKIIGTKGINTLLIASGVQKILDTRYKKFESIWKNSYKTAFYAQKIAMQLKRTRISEFAYLGALLSDIGKIVLLSLKQENIEKLSKITGNQNLSDTNILEEITLGISHSTLGSLICKKWQFNDALAKCIEFHHRPHLAPLKYKELTFIVYLAYILSEIEERNFRFELIDEDVLEHYNLTNKKNFEILHSILKDAYNAYSNINKNKK